MSLLLDALKKAALDMRNEKHDADHSNAVGMDKDSAKTSSNDEYINDECVKHRNDSSNHGREAEVVNDIDNVDIPVSEVKANQRADIEIEVSENEALINTGLDIDFNHEYLNINDSSNEEQHDSEECNSENKASELDIVNENNQIIYVDERTASQEPLGSAKDKLSDLDEKNSEREKIDLENQKESIKKLILIENKQNNKEKKWKYSLSIIVFITAFSVIYLYMMFDPIINDNSINNTVLNSKATSDEFVVNEVKESIKGEEKKSIYKENISQEFANRRISIVNKRDQNIAGSVVENKNSSLKKKPIKSVNKKTKVVSVTESNMASAYENFNKGDYLLADNKYDHALIENKRNRNALLGKAAVALKTNNLVLAESIYSDILDDNPKDIEAKTAILMLKDILSDTDINDVSLLLRENYDSAPLNFLMGNINAENKQWRAANENFKRAYSLDKKNPDYAFNLGVTYDQVNEYQQAIKFYLLSLQSLKNRNYSFNIDHVTKRIVTLKDYLNANNAR